MGFTTGFIGGITLTTSILYLTISVHQRNRATQSAFLRHQAATLNNFIEPALPSPPPTSRETRVNWTETWKDRWNAELENAVRKLYAIDWDKVREGVEDRTAALWAAAFRKAREEAPDPPKTEASK
ncbi:MAG: hypothetical protein M1821_006177 [Bathelium mastoideum]|nr:MAG: hypothetical protein M1821_006177 [Bathelium mastoideum]